jgi:four helix bundle protein
MNWKAEALKARTKRFVLDVLDLVETLPRRGPAVRIAWQLVDAATSVGANYRAACRARSDAEFAAKIGQVLEESDESLFWLELCDARAIGLGPLRAKLLDEANELTAIFAASSITARQTAATGRLPSPRSSD